MAKLSIRKFYPLMIVLCVPFLAGAACQTSVTNPCDVLVPLTPAPATNQYIVTNDRPFAQQVAMARGRYQNYNCE